MAQGASDFLLRVCGHCRQIMVFIRRSYLVTIDGVIVATQESMVAVFKNHGRRESDR